MLPLFVSNTSVHDIEIVRGEILAVFDTLSQPPIECYKPDDKHNDHKLDT